MQNIYFISFILTLSQCVESTDMKHYKNIILLAEFM